MKGAPQSVEEGLFRAAALHLPLPSLQLQVHPGVKMLSVRSRMMRSRVLTSQGKSLLSQILLRWNYQVLIKHFE